MRMVDFTHNSMANVMTEFPIVDISYLNTNIQAYGVFVLLVDMVFSGLFEL